MSYPYFLKESDNSLKQALITGTNLADSTNYPETNIIDLPISKPLRILNLATNKIHFSFAGTKSFNFFALIGHNLSSTATITLRAGATFDAATLTQSITWRKGTAYVKLSAASTAYQYWSVSITDEANPHGFIEIGYALAGVVTELDEFSFDIGWEYLSRQFNVRTESETGTPIFRNLTSGEAIGVRFSFRSAAEMLTLRTLFSDLKGSSGPFFFVPDPDVYDGFFGRFEDDEFLREFPTHSTFNRQSVQVRLKSDPPGRTIVTPLPIIQSGEDLPEGSTFTRASTAWYKNRDLKLVQAAINELRDPHYVANGLRGILLEGQRTNMFTRSEEFDHADWTKVNTSVSANAINEPKASPGTVADRLIEDGVLTTHGLSQTKTITSNGFVSFSVFAKANTRSWIFLQVRDAVGNNQFRGWFNLSTGVVGTAANLGTATDATIHIEAYGDGWYRCMIRGKINNSETSGIFRICMSTGDTVTSYQGDASSSVYVWGAQAEDNVGWPSSYIPTTSAAVTRSADVCLIPWAFTPQPMSAYAKLVEITQANPTLQAIVWLLGNDASPATEAYLALLKRASTIGYNLSHDPGTGVLATVAGVSLGSAVEVLGQLYPDGDVQVHTAAASSARTASDPGIDPTWAEAQLVLGGSFTTTAPMVLQCLKFYRGAQSMAFMRTL